MNVLITQKIKYIKYDDINVDFLRAGILETEKNIFFRLAPCPIPSEKKIRFQSG